MLLDIKYFNTYMYIHKTTYIFIIHNDHAYFTHVL